MKARSDYVPSEMSRSRSVRELKLENLDESPCSTVTGGAAERPGRRSEEMSWWESISSVIYCPES